MPPWCMYIHDDAMVCFNVVQCMNMQCCMLRSQCSWPSSQPSPLIFSIYPGSYQIPVPMPISTTSPDIEVDTVPQQSNDQSLPPSHPAIDEIAWLPRVKGGYSNVVSVA